MGEKIKDLHSVKIGSSEFMIELNAGGTPSEGRVIHIQNEHFRYLLKEKYFLQLAATIFRAKSELDYLKKTMPEKLKDKEIKNTDFTDAGEEEIADYVCRILSDAEIPYRLLEIRPKIVTFVIKDKAYKKYTALLGSDKRLRKSVHLFSKEFGYRYMYKMRPFELYHADNDAYVEFYFQLPCKSLTKKTWIPLHRSVQERIWEKNDKNEKGYSVIDPLVYAIYRLCWAVFEHEAFSEYDIEVIRKGKDLLQTKESRDLLQEIFFKYSDELISHIMNDEFSLIIPSYYRFRDY